MVSNLSQGGASKKPLRAPSLIRLGLNDLVSTSVNSLRNTLHMPFSTKSFLFILIGLAAQPAIMAADKPTDTAYSALRVFGKQSGTEALKHVVEMRGRSGTPDPEVWKVTVEDGSARGGLREVEFRKGHVLSERSPTARPVGEPMNLNQLNLDSDGVFTIANQEAEKLSIPFDHVDYTLKTGTHGGAPVWDIDLFEGRSGRVCTFSIAADSGTILHRDIVHAQPGPDTSGDQAYVHDVPPADQPRYVESDQDQPIRNPGDFFHRVKKHFEKRGRQFENFFTGRGWTDH